MTDPKIFKNYTKNLNDKYYSGRDFDIRLKVDEKKVTEDGKKIQVAPAKMIQSAYDSPNKARVQFQINYDKDRKNLNTNTVTFAHKFNQSQPKFKTQKQYRNLDRRAPP